MTDAARRRFSRRLEEFEQFRDYSCHKPAAMNLIHDGAPKRAAIGRL
jgi:hypothetical protein